MLSCSSHPQLRRLMLAQRLQSTNTISHSLRLPLRCLTTRVQQTPPSPPSSCLPISVSTSPQPGSSSSSPRSSISYTPRPRSSTRQPHFELLSLFSQPRRHASSSSSSSKWTSRQSSDPFTREAKLLNLKSRAAFKLLQINERYHLLRPGMTVVDLGYAPGSWSQVAIDLVRPGVGRVVGVDVIPVQPPKGVNGMQGDFLSPEVQARVREFLRDETRGRLQRSPLDDDDIENTTAQLEEAGYVDRERAATSETDNGSDSDETIMNGRGVEDGDKCVDVVLSDMSAPWQLNISKCKNSVNNPYRRMMNTTGNRFRDHAMSMDLCRSALYFSHSTLRVGGSLVCKFYQGPEDKQFEKQLRAMFGKVHREKPESSRSESREGFFVALKRLPEDKIEKGRVFDEG